MLIIIFIYALSFCGKVVGFVETMSESEVENGGADFFNKRLRINLKAAQNTVKWITFRLYLFVLTCCGWWFLVIEAN